MKLLTITAGVALFAAIALAVRYHFRSPSMSWGMRTISLLTFAGAAAFVAVLWPMQRETPPLAIALALFVVSGGIFFWALHESRAARLKLALDPDGPTSVLATGPYRYVRHPFYTSYIIYWLACAIATGHPLNIAFLVVMTATYIYVASGEERSFQDTPHAAAYAKYRETAGLFWPKLW